MPWNQACRPLLGLAIPHGGRENPLHSLGDTMPGRPRTPTAVLEAKGAFAKNPARGRARSGEPRSTGGLGDPPPYFMIQEPETGFRKAGILRELWREIGATAPWLDAANRGQVETLCRIRYAIRLGEGKLNVNAASQSKLENDLGITQSARSRCNVPSKPPERAVGDWQTLAEEGRRARPN